MDVHRHSAAPEERRDPTRRLTLLANESAPPDRLTLAPSSRCLRVLRSPDRAEPEDVIGALGSLELEAPLRLEPALRARRGNVIRLRRPHSPEPTAA
ncbi:MAG: hypothetical protein QOK40_1660 [Miltoncostaeaceae bacterium]|jgi:hypothetical protein|nr:hypothetical protein [Miltoncostaeaceae bacterium]